VALTRRTFDFFGKIFEMTLPTRWIFAVDGRTPPPNPESPRSCRTRLAVSGFFVQIGSIAYHERRVDRQHRQ
jgi:hypothetical protein